MFRRAPLLACLALALLPQVVRAGGPAWLCLPLDGVTADNSQSCADRLKARLQDRMPEYSAFQGVQIRENHGQWYLMFHLAKDVPLADIEAALKDSAFSIPRDKLHIFGHVTLVVDPQRSSTKKILTALLSMEHTSIAGMEEKNSLLNITVDMLYPAGSISRETWEAAASAASFERCDFSSDKSTKSEPPISPASLPGYNTFRDVLAKQNATLKDIFWNPNYACREVGAVTANQPDRVSSAK